MSSRAENVVSSFGRLIDASVSSFPKPVTYEIAPGAHLFCSYNGDMRDTFDVGLVVDGIDFPLGEAGLDREAAIVALLAYMYEFTMNLREVRNDG